MPVWTLAVPVVVAVSVFLFQMLQARLPANVREEAMKLVDIVVGALEQAMPDATGPEKKAAAVALLRAIARSLHLNVPATLFDVLIEATVGAMNAARPLPQEEPGSMGFHSPTVLEPRLDNPVPAGRILFPYCDK